MPTLKQIKCQIELAGSDLPLREHQTSYGDGFVETFVAVPDLHKGFTIRLTSHGYIASGIGMFVFMDGVYQCNRYRQGLIVPTIDSAAAKTEVDFRVRQKEETKGSGHFIGRDWTFEKLNTVSADQAPNTNLDILGNVGTIEVVVLRCKGSTQPGQTQPISKTDMSNEAQAKDEAKQEVIETAIPGVASDAASVMGSFAAIFDGPASELRPDFGHYRGDWNGGYNSREPHREPPIGQRRESTPPFARVRTVTTSAAPRPDRDAAIVIDQSSIPTETDVYRGRFRRGWHGQERSPAPPGSVHDRSNAWKNRLETERYPYRSDFEPQGRSHKGIRGAHRYKYTEDPWPPQRGAAFPGTPYRTPEYGYEGLQRRGENREVHHSYRAPMQQAQFWDEHNSPNYHVPPSGYAQREFSRAPRAHSYYPSGEAVDPDYKGSEEYEQTWANGPFDRYRQHYGYPTSGGNWWNTTPMLDPSKPPETDSHRRRTSQFVGLEEPFRGRPTHRKETSNKASRGSNRHRDDSRHRRHDQREQDYHQNDLDKGNMKRSSGHEARQPPKKTNPSTSPNDTSSHHSRRSRPGKQSSRRGNSDNHGRGNTGSQSRVGKGSQIERNSRTYEGRNRDGPYGEWNTNDQEVWNQAAQGSNQAAWNSNESANPGGWNNGNQTPSNRNTSGGWNNDKEGGWNQSDQESSKHSSPEGWNKGNQGDWNSGNQGGWNSGDQGDWNNGNQGDWNSGNQGGWNSGDQGGWDTGKQGDWNNGNQGGWNNSNQGGWNSGSPDRWNKSNQGRWNSNNGGEGGDNWAKSDRNQNIEHAKNDGQRNNGWVNGSKAGSLRKGSVHRSKNPSAASQSTVSQGSKKTRRTHRTSQSHKTQATHRSQKNGQWNSNNDQWGNGGENQWSGEPNNQQRDSNNHGQDANNDNGNWQENNNGTAPTEPPPAARVPIPSELKVKSYWTSWKEAHKPETTESNSAKKRSRTELIYVAPEEPLYTIPQTTAQEMQVDHQVKVGRGAAYCHRVGKPEYLDSMEAPYAVFSFKYRSKATLEQILGTSIVESPDDYRQRLLALSKDELVEKLMSTNGPDVQKEDKKVGGDHASAAAWGGGEQDQIEKAGDWSGNGGGGGDAGGSGANAGSSRIDDPNTTGAWGSGRGGDGFDNSAGAGRWGGGGGGGGWGDGDQEHGGSGGSVKSGSGGGGGW
ncbi:MAG: hypothetical protein Q9157_001785 [Trypethelium eluteriae]